MPELWTTAVAEIKERIGKQNFETWIKPISFVSRNRNEILLDVPSKFFREWLMEHYLAEIETTLRSLAKQDVKVIFEINDKLAGQSNIEKPLKKDEKEREKPQRNNNLVAKYTFQNFVVVLSNDLPTPPALPSPTSPAITTILYSSMAGSVSAKLIW